MFIVWAGSVLTTALAIAMGTGHMPGNAMFTGAISLWLWFTVLFANFAEALAEGRSKAQANSLKGVKKPPSRASYVNQNTARRWTTSRRMNCVKAMWCWWKRVTSSPATGKLLRGRIGGRKRHHRGICAGDP